MLLSALVVSAFVAAGAPRENPSSEMTKSPVLSSQIRAALEKAYPGFQVRKKSEFMPSVLKGYRFTNAQSPSFVVGDFNGDGAADAAVMGHDKEHDLTVVALSERKGNFRVLEISKARRSDAKTISYVTAHGKETGFWSYLSLRPRGPVSSPHEGKGVQLLADGFEINYFEKASTLYFFKEGKFEKYATSD